MQHMFAMLASTTSGGGLDATSSTTVGSLIAATGRAVCWAAGMRLSSFAAVIGCLVSSYSPAAQDRKPGFVVVTATDGKPIANATVTCVATAIADPWLQQPEIVHATTDARGRARVDLRPSTAYITWALAPSSAETRACTAMSTELYVGGEVALVASKIARAVQLQVTGTEAWSDAGPVRARWWLTGTALHGELDLQAGEATLPHLPGTARVELLDGRGDALLAATTSKGASLKLQLPAPRRMPCIVQDAGGKPLAGATIWQRTTIDALESWRNCGTSGADGKVAALVVSAENPLGKRCSSAPLFIARKEGYREGLSGWLEGQFAVNGEYVPAGTFAELPFQLPKQAPLTGTLRRGDQLLAGHRLDLTLSVTLQVRPTSRQGIIRHLRAISDADGHFAFPPLPAGQFNCVLQVGRPAAQGPDPTAAAGPFSLPLAVENQPLNLDLAKLRHIRVQVPDWQLGPGRRGTLLLVPLTNAGQAERDAAVRCPLDSVGCATLTALPGRWFLFASDGDGYCAQLVEIGAEDVQLDLQLQPLTKVAGRLSTKAGQPVAGAGFRVTTASTIPGRGKDELRDCVTTMYYTIQNDLLSRTRTAADGSFTLSCLDLPKQATSNGCAVLEGRESASFSLSAGPELDLRW